MSGICLGVAMSVIQAVLPGDSLELSWQHSVEKIQWTERYSLEDRRIVLTEATVEGSGAGMEPPDGAVFDGKEWRYKPVLPPMKSVLLTRSSFTSDYRVCQDGTCRTLTEIVGPLRQEGETMQMFPCP